MAIYHTRVKTFSRAKGDSCVAAAAYRAGLRLTDPRTGKRHDYRLRGGVVETRCIVPKDAPTWAWKPSELWAAAEAAEKRSDATIAREFEIALPHELDGPQRSRLVSALGRALVERYGFAIQASIHAPDTPDGLNWHAHLRATTRRIGKDGLADKTRELDGGASGRVEIEWTREMVADTINRYLDEAEIAARVDHRSLEAQAEAAIERGDLAAALGLTRQPTVHLGKHATALERKGVPTDLGEINTTIADNNAAAFDAMLAAYQAGGRSMPVPEGHSADRARRARKREKGMALGTSVGSGEIRVVRGLSRKAATDPAEAAVDWRTPAGRRKAAKDAFEEALALWEAGFASPVGIVFVHTPRLLACWAERLRAHLNAPQFVVMARELPRLLKRLVRDAGRLLRRKAAATRAEVLLTGAQRALEDFDEKHPRPALWSRREWAKRRARRTAAVEQRKAQAKAAREAAGEEAAQAYAEQVKASAEAVEAWSADMLNRYPLDGDGPVSASSEAPTEPETLTQAVPGEGDATTGGATRGPRFRLPF